MSRSLMVSIPSCFEALTKGFVMKKEIKGIQENKERLNTSWTGEAATAAQSALDEIISLYNDLLATVTSTHESLASAANAFSDTDSSNASMFN